MHIYFFFEDFQWFPNRLSTLLKIFSLFIETIGTLGSSKWVLAYCRSIFALGLMVNLLKLCFDKLFLHTLFNFIRFNKDD